MMSLEEFTRQVDQLVEGGKSTSDMIQLADCMGHHPEAQLFVYLQFDPRNTARPGKFARNQARGTGEL